MMISSPAPAPPLSRSINASSASTKGLGNPLFDLSLLICCLDVGGAPLWKTKDFSAVSTQSLISQFIPFAPHN
jgi:hypothetical protein